MVPRATIITLALALASATITFADICPNPPCCPQTFCSGNIVCAKDNISRTCAFGSTDTCYTCVADSSSNSNTNGIVVTSAYVVAWWVWLLVLIGIVGFIAIIVVCIRKSRKQSASTIAYSSGGAPPMMAPPMTDAQTLPQDPEQGMARTMSQSHV